MSRLSKLYDWWKRLDESYLETEIRRVQKARGRHQDRMDDIGRAWKASGGFCCPGCFSAGEYNRLAEKVYRIDELLAQLRRKHETHTNDL